MDQMTVMPTTSHLRGHFLGGLAVHGVAVLLFGVLAVVGLEGCDMSDNLAGAAGIALLVDIVMTIVGVFVALRRRRSGAAPVVTGWLLSFVVPVGLFVIVMLIANSLPSGCAA